MEQSYEWNSSVYVNFIDFTKVFNSVHRPALWKILSHYGIQDKVISIIRMLYVDFTARVICGSSLTDEIWLETGVKQGCLLSPLLFILCIDWAMAETTSGRKRWITWTMTDMLEDLDFADDTALLSHRHRDIQEMTNDMATTGKQIDLNINASKTKILVYLGSKITSYGNSEVEVLARTVKARGEFVALNNIWRSTKISNTTKLKIFKSNVIGVLLYGAESWKRTNSIVNKLDVFQTRCLRRILRIFWPRTISNADMYKSINTKSLSQK